MGKHREPPTPLRLLLLGLATTTVLAAGCADDPVLPGEAPAIDSPGKLVEALSRAYEQRDHVLFASLLAHDLGNQADYVFIPADPEPGDARWDYAEETRIHQRMFDPAHPLPGDTMVPPELWLLNVVITLTLDGDWTENLDASSRQGSLDPARWRAMTARFHTDVLFELAGETDYRIRGQSRFVVLEDLQKNVGDAGKFSFLTWEDLGRGPFSVLAAEGATWSNVKSLYR